MASPRTITATALTVLATIIVERLVSDVLDYIEQFAGGRVGAMLLRAILLVLVFLGLLVVAGPKSAGPEPAPPIPLWVFVGIGAVLGGGIGAIRSLF